MGGKWENINKQKQKRWKKKEKRIQTKFGSSRLEIGKKKAKIKSNEIKEWNNASMFELDRNQSLILGDMSSSMAAVDGSPLRGGAPTLRASLAPPPPFCATVVQLIAMQILALGVSTVLSAGCVPALCFYVCLYIIQWTTSAINDDSSCWRKWGQSAIRLNELIVDVRFISSTSCSATSHWWDSISRFLVYLN